MTSNATLALAEGGIYAAAMITCENSFGRKNGHMPTTSSSMSQLHTCSLIVVCPGLHYLSFTNTASTPPFLLPLCFVLSSCNRGKPSSVAFVSGVSSICHVSVNTLIVTLYISKLYIYYNGTKTQLFGSWNNESVNNRV